MFNRPPRIQHLVKQYKFDIIPPNPVPAKPKVNWLTLGLPIIASGLMVVLMFIFSSSTSGLSYLMFLPFIVASVLASVINFKKQDKEYRENLSASKDVFKKRLIDVKEEVKKSKEEIRKTLNQNNLSPLECIDIVSKEDPRIGERRPSDSDFLSFRIGIGKQPSSIEVTGIPVQNREPEYDNFYADADQIVNEAKVIENIPLICDFKRVGNVGIAGKIDDIRRLSWNCIINLLTNHWPSELNIAAFCSMVEINNWLWIKTVQHKSNIFNEPVIELRDNLEVKKALTQLEEEIRRRKTLLLNSRIISGADKKELLIPSLVFIFDRVPEIYKHAAFSLLLNEGRQLGVYGIFIVDTIQDIPSECGAIISISNGSELLFQITGEDPNNSFVGEMDSITTESVQSFSKAISNIQWLIPKQVTEPPEQLSLLELFPYHNLQDLPISTWWDGESPFGYLKAPIGKYSPTADLIFNLNDTDTGHGPHGLIGGMTGSGKSELLKTLILSLAVTHHPYDLNFALIDFKGGSTFNEFKSLPHVVGVITDIQNHADYATRVIQSLSWEIKKREKLLITAREIFNLGNVHIDEYRKKLQTRIPVPRLVIIFDEFAEFQERHPEESKRLINIARVGRSLGIHIILCTQNPSGKAIDQQVRDNSNFTICMKVKSTETSKSLIGIPDAIQLHRGEAYFNVDGPQKFRVAYTGETHYSSNRNSKQVCNKQTSEAQAIIEEISMTSKKNKIPNPLPVWYPPLSNSLTLDNLFTNDRKKPSWNGSEWVSVSFQEPQLPLGLIDDPSHQTQTIFHLHDNLIIYGPSCSGKSTSLISAMMSIGLSYSPAEAFIYCIDITGQSPLKILADSGFPFLPRDGTIIFGSDTERINRLFKMLRNRIAERVEKFRKAGVKNIRTYNTKNDLPVKELEPYLFIFIDGINPQFNGVNPGFKDQLDNIIRQGPNNGVFVILTGNLPRDIPEILFNDISEKIILRTNDMGNIRAIVGSIPEAYQKKIEVGQEPEPGRGLVKANTTLEIQMGYPIDGDENNFINNISAISNLMSTSWNGNRPPDVESLACFLPISQVKVNETDDRFILGIDQESLEPIGFSLYSDAPIYTIVSMAPGQGKTATLQLILLQLIKKYNPKELQLILIDFHSHSFRMFSKIPHIVTVDKKHNFHAYISRKDQLLPVLDWLNNEIRLRRESIEKIFSADPENFNKQSTLNSMSQIVLVIDDYDSFCNSSTIELQKLQTVIIDGFELGIRLIIAENIALIGKDSLSKLALKYSNGLLLGGSDGLSLFNGTQPPYGQKTSNLPAGRGYFIRRNQAQLIQVIAYWEGRKDPEDALRKIIYSKDDH